MMMDLEQRRALVCGGAGRRRWLEGARERTAVIARAGTASETRVLVHRLRSPVGARCVAPVASTLSNQLSAHALGAASRVPVPSLRSFGAMDSRDCRLRRPGGVSAASQRAYGAERTSGQPSGGGPRSVPQPAQRRRAPDDSAGLGSLGCWPPPGRVWPRVMGRFSRCAAAYARGTLFCCVENNTSVKSSNNFPSHSTCKTKTRVGHASRHCAVPIDTAHCCCVSHWHPLVAPGTTPQL